MNREWSWMNPCVMFVEELDQRNYHISWRWLMSSRDFPAIFSIRRNYSSTRNRHVLMVWFVDTTDIWFDWWVTVQNGYLYHGIHVFSTVVSADSLNLTGQLLQVRAPIRLSWPRNVPPYHVCFRKNKTWPFQVWNHSSTMRNTVVALYPLSICLQHVTTGYFLWD